MGEDTKKSAAGDAAAAATNRKPWHKPQLRKIDPAAQLTEIFDAMQGEPPKRERRLRRA